MTLPRQPSADAALVTAAEFAADMASCGPFEPAPVIACAVSGGPDSLCLLTLLHEWVEEQGGRLVALTVDHGLRAEAAAEIAVVAAVAERLGIAHHVLRWRGAKPAGAVQVAARQARYRLLGDYCASRGILHLALAHHRDDLAETFLLRLASGSGPEGLAAMSRITVRPALRYLRPLLTVPKARLCATLTARGLAWCEDPSNRDLRHRRVQQRALLNGLKETDVGHDWIIASVDSFGALRSALEPWLARVLSRLVSPHPAGFVLVDRAGLDRLPLMVACHVLERILRSVGGLVYPPRRRSVARLQAALAGGQTRPVTLGGCLLVPGRQGRLLVMREPQAPRPRRLAAGETLHWDGRFLLRLDAARWSGPALTVRPLGAAGWLSLRRHLPPDAGAGLPHPVLCGLPALLALDEIVAVPHLFYRRGDVSEGAIDCRLWPHVPLVAAFTAAVQEGQTGRAEAGAA